MTGRQATVQLSEASDLVLDMHSLKCRGTHNMVNAGVAAALVAALRFPGVDENALQSGLSSLTGLPHRMQARMMENVACDRLRDDRSIKSSLLLALPVVVFHPVVQFPCTVPHPRLSPSTACLLSGKQVRADTPS